MESKEKKWTLDKVGYLSASRLDDLMTKGRAGKELWGQTAINYLYRIERERWLNEPTEPATAGAMTWGIEQEPYAFAWMRENFDGMDIRHYDQDFDEKIFRKVDWAKYGASPDGDVYNSVTDEIEALIEVKCVYGDKSIAQYFSPYRDYAKKKAEAFNEHKEQLAGQLLVYPKVDRIILVKYDGQSDYEFDMRPPTDKSRGITFTFTRSEFGSYLDEVQEKIIKSDQYLDLHLDLDQINEYYAISK